MVPKSGSKKQAILMDNEMKQLVSIKTMDPVSGPCLNNRLETPFLSKYSNACWICPAHLGRLG